MTAKVLLLNASYQPIRAMNIKDAVDLIMREKVEEAWGSGHIDIQTPNQVFKLPTILRLKHMVNVPDRKATSSRELRRRAVALGGRRRRLCIALRSARRAGQGDRHRARRA